jgi:hypothetical protein
VGAQGAFYPTDQVGRQQLADALTAKGLKPTQRKQHFDRDKIDKMAAAMKAGTFDWNKASLQRVQSLPCARMPEFSLFLASS